MPDNESLRSVLVEVPGEHLPELMTVLGKFGVEHDVSIEIADSVTTLGQPDETLESYVFHSDYTTVINDSESGQEITVITLENFQDFSVMQTGSTIAGTKFYNSVMRKPISERQARIWSHIVADIFDEGSVIKAARAKYFLKALERGALSFSGVAEGQIKFFAQFCEKVILDNDSAQ